MVRCPFAEPWHPSQEPVFKLSLIGECGAGKSVEQWCADVERMLPDEALELQHLIPALAPKFASVEAASLYEEATNNDEYLKYVEDEDYAKAWATFQEVILGDGGFSEASARLRQGFSKALARLQRGFSDA